MSKEVKWTKAILEAFIEEALLSEEEINILTTRCKGMTIVEQSLRFSMSTSKVNKIVSRLKVKYDAVQIEHPDKFPKRRNSVEETYMDTH